MTMPTIRKTNKSPKPNKANKKRRRNALLQLHRAAKSMMPEERAKKHADDVQEQLNESKWDVDPIKLFDEIEKDDL